MEFIVAVIVFGILLGIALMGLAISNRQARMNNASRHAGGATIHPHDQRLRGLVSGDRPQDRS